MANTLILEGCRIFLKNFSGRPDKYDPKGGKRNFCVWLDEETVDGIIEDGWNVKWTKPRDEQEDPRPYLKVKLAYGANPNFWPAIYICTKRNKTLLTEDTIGSLDIAGIKNVDLVIRPYDYDTAGHQGRAAYVKSMYVTIEEDPFASKYEFETRDDDEEAPF